MSADAVTGLWVDGVPPWAGFAPITVDVHVYERTELRAVVHAQEGRVVLHVEGANRAAVHLFTERAELVRLIEMASAALVELDTGRDAASAA